MSLRNGKSTVKAVNIRQTFRKTGWLSGTDWAVS